MEVGPGFFGAVAGVLPTLAVAVFLVRRKASKQTERAVKADIGRMGIAELIFMFVGMLLLQIAAVVLVCYAQLVALLALGAGGGTQRAQAVCIVAVGIMLFFLAGAALPWGDLGWIDKAQATGVFVIFLLLIGGALAQLGYVIENIDLRWVFGWLR